MTLRLLLLASLPAVALLLATSCGGDDNLSDIKSTATAAAAKVTTQPTAAGGVAEYRTAITTAADAFRKNIDQLNKDLLSAQANQADPKVPQTLKNDIQLVGTSGAAVKAVKPPDSLAAQHKEISDGVDAVQKGADLFGKAVDSGDQSTGLQAFTALATGRAQFEAAMAKLPK